MYAERNISAGHDERGDRVGALEPHEQDQGRGDRRPDEGVEVGDDVPERSLDVQARRFARARVQAAARFTTMPASATASITPPLTSGGRNEALDRLEDDHRGEDEERDPVHLRREDLDPPEAEGHGSLRGSSGEVDGEDREADRGGVREHVSGVGEERQRVGDDPRRDLECHEPDDEGERDPELRAIRVRGCAVSVRPRSPRVSRAVGVR